MNKFVYEYNTNFIILLIKIHLISNLQKFKPRITNFQKNHLDPITFYVQTVFGF